MPISLIFTLHVLTSHTHHTHLVVLKFMRCDERGQSMELRRLALSRWRWNLEVKCTVAALVIETKTPVPPPAPGHFIPDNYGFIMAEAIVM